MLGTLIKFFDGKKVVLFVGVFLITALLIFVHIKNLPYSFDDSYIHFRIAKNFVETGQPYFNLGEPVLASSSIAWTIFLSLIFFLFGPYPILVAIINAVFCVIGAGIFLKLYKVIHYDGASSSSSLIISFVYICAIFNSSLGLMEIAVSMTIYGIALLLVSKRNNFSLVLLGMLPFFRLEFVFFCFLIVAYILIKRLFTLKSILINMFIGALPFLVFELFYFGTVIPNTVIAKSQGYEPDRVYILISELEYLVPPFQLTNHLTPGYFLIIRVVLIYLLISLLFIIIWKRRCNLLRFESILIMNGLLVMLFYVVGETVIFPWYGPLFMIPLLLGIICSIPHNAKFPKILISLLVLPLALNTLVSLIGLVSGQFQFVYGFNVNARVAQYLTLGKKIYQKYPNAVLATSEIGGLGWGFEGYIADGFGLVSPKAIPYQASLENNADGSIASGYIKEIQPEIIVSMDIFDRSVRESEYVKNYIHFIEPIYLPEDERILGEQTLWNASHINLYIRKDIWCEQE